jgi:hypothetical protein
LEIKRLDQENCQEDDDDARSKWCLLLLFFCDIIFFQSQFAKRKASLRSARPKKKAAQEGREAIMEPY